MKIDFGCGPNKREGFEGVDCIAFEGVDHIFDAGSDTFPFGDGTVEEAHASHFVEHLTAKQRIHFFNELHRVLVVGAKVTVICPHWSSTRAYGDPTHQWPPFSEFAMFYLEQKWRDNNAPHTDIKNWPEGYKCNFTSTWGYGIHESLQTRNTEFQQFAINFYKEAAQDIHATLTKLE